MERTLKTKRKLITISVMGISCTNNYYTPARLSYGIISGATSSTPMARSSNPRMWKQVVWNWNRLKQTFRPQKHHLVGEQCLCIHTGTRNGEVCRSSDFGWRPLLDQLFHSRGATRTHGPNYQTSSHLGGTMVSVLAIGPKIRGFKPGRGDAFLRAI
jgi:hypothetical protein